MKPLDSIRIAIYVVAVMFILGCSHPKSVLSPLPDQDTLYTTLILRDTTYRPECLYRLFSGGPANRFDTLYSNTTPPNSTPVNFDSNGSCMQVFIHEPPTITIVGIDTTYRFVHGNAPEDTAFIFDTLSSSATNYRDTVSVRIDTIEAYRRAHRPYFGLKDSLTKLLGAPTEGKTQYVRFPAYHFNSDSATITVVNCPAWVRLEWISNCEGFGDCWFYQGCVDGAPVIFACWHSIAKTGSTPIGEHTNTRPYLVLAADSTALDSTFAWKVVIANKYGLSDTLDINSRVTPFPYACR